MADTQPTNEAQATPGSGALLLKDRGGYFGIKAGMTQVYTKEGEAVAVTVIHLRPNVVTQVKTKAKEGYQSVQIGMLEKADKKMTSAEKNHLKKSGAKTGFYNLKEIRLPDTAKMEGMAPGQVISPEFIKEGDLVDLTAVSKGKGFQGTMKLHNFAGGYATHGASLVHRSLGSIGNRADPGKVFKGKKLPAHMGHEQITIQNVKVIRVDAENQVLLVNGSVPGPRSGMVSIRRAIKSSKSKTTKSSE